MINNSYATFNKFFLQELSNAFQLLIATFLVIIETTTALFFQTNKTVAIKLPIIYANIRV